MGEGVLGEGVTIVWRWRVLESGGGDCSVGYSRVTSSTLQHSLLPHSPPQALPVPTPRVSPSSTSYSHGSQ